MIEDAAASQCDALHDSHVRSAIRTRRSFARDVVTRFTFAHVLVGEPV